MRMWMSAVRLPWFPAAPAPSPTKQAAAQAAGAIGIVVYNNASGMLNMQINDGGDNIPAVFVSKADGEYMKAQFAEGVKTLTCCNGDLVQVKRDRTLSDFSSGASPRT